MPSITKRSYSLKGSSPLIRGELSKGIFLNIFVMFGCERNDIKMKYLLLAVSSSPSSVPSLSLLCQSVLFKSNVQVKLWNCRFYLPNSNDYKTSLSVKIMMLTNWWYCGVKHIRLSIEMKRRKSIPEKNPFGQI